MIAMVVATDTRGAIGRENKIPWRLRSDLVKLRKLTLDHTVILGRKTYDSMVAYYNKSGRQMPGKMYIVVTRNADYKPARENARIVHSVQAALDLAKQLNDENIMVIGGGAIFTALLPVADRIYLTEVQTEVEGDSYFPKLDRREWHEISHEHHQKDEKNEYDFDLMVLERK
jgi:dihydrofolate reductase